MRWLRSSRRKKTTGSREEEKEKNGKHIQAEVKMLIKLKNGMDYFLLKSDGKYYLLTDRKEKTDSSFEYWRNLTGRK